MCQFLRGLSETYIGFKNNLLMVKSFPSLDSAYNILLQNERQRQVMLPTHFSNDSASFYVNVQKKISVSNSYSNRPFSNAYATKSSYFTKPPNAYPLKSYNQKVIFDKTSHFCFVSIAEGLII